MILQTKATLWTTNESLIITIIVKKSQLCLILLNKIVQKFNNTTEYIQNLLSYESR